MPKYMSIWRVNPAQWPTDPTEAAQLNEGCFAFYDEALKSGQVLEVGFFADGSSGYVIRTGEDAKGAFAGAFGNFPWMLVEVHEVIDYETGKGIARQVMKAQAEQMAATKR